MAKRGASGDEARFRALRERDAELASLATNEAMRQRIAELESENARLRVRSEAFDEVTRSTTFRWTQKLARISSTLRRRPSGTP